MTKRTESNSQRSRRKPNAQSKKRRLMMEGLESRQLMAVLTDVPTAPAPTNLPEFDSPRNIGTVPSFSYAEVENTSTLGTNDFRSTAEILPFGTGPGQQDTIDISGTSPVSVVGTTETNFLTDIDTYGFDLRAGDIVDIATGGAAGEFAIQGPFGPTGLPLPGQPAVAVSFNASVPVGGLASPLQSVGNVTGTFVTPQDGRYFLTVGAATQTTTYSVGLRAYRPVTESLAYGDAQILYLDWEGGIVDNNLFNTDAIVDGLPTFGFTVVPSLEESLPFLGLEFGNVDLANRIAEDVYEDVVRVFEDIGNSGTNGDFEVSGVAGEYALRILNSRDPIHRQWYESNSADPRITRMIIGGTGLDIGRPGVFGVAEYVDIGNFDLTQLGLFALDGFQGDTLGSPLSPAASPVDATIQFLSSVIAHEAGHTFGMLHTVNTNSILTLSDAGGGTAVANGLGVGVDGIFGTLDDVAPIFRDDFYAAEVFSGFNRVTDNLSHVLSSGTAGGGSVSGTVFGDLNRDGSSAGEGGVAGVRVFVDRDGDGAFDSNEVSTLTDSTGGFTLPIASTGASIAIVAPDGTVPTTPASITVTSATNQTLSFGIGSSASATSSIGTIYVDANGNDVADPGEGVGDVFVFADLDGDQRPDLGEPNSRSNADGTYNLTFPNVGNYDIRILRPAGFDFDTPSDGVNTVGFNGTSYSGTGDFILEASRDFGDAPATYGTLLADGGASHGIIDELFLGGTVADAELDGQPSTDASGDDNLGVDDEDGVRLITPLGPGNTGSFEVLVNNTTGLPAFLQGFLDFNADGDFNDAGEQFLVDRSVVSSTSAQSISVPVAVPADAVIGSTIARFRLSQSSNIGANGFADTGEVEDYSVPILTTAEIANDDDVSVSRNTLANRLDVLANDFDTADNPLVIESINPSGLRGVAVITNGGRSIDYTPPNGFVGQEQFIYTVRDTFGNRSTATVTITVNFQSDVPFAIDDTFEISRSPGNRALNVLENDVASTAGGLIIISATNGDNGGSVQVVGGGQSVRYSAPQTLRGTDQFQYSIQDLAGNVSTATVTVNLLPESREDDVVDFQIEILGSDGQTLPTVVSGDTLTPIVEVGDNFQVRVTVEDLDLFNERMPGGSTTVDEGVASAFLDLLYSDTFVSTIARQVSGDNEFDFQVEFGPDFQPIQVDDEINPDPNGDNVDAIRFGSAAVPGLINEIGGLQTLDRDRRTPHDGPITLFTITMTARSPGVAEFKADPADNQVSETVIFDSDDALPVAQLRLGTAELVIAPVGTDFAAAIDDSFPLGADSNNQPIVPGRSNPNVLNVLANDNLGPTGLIREFGFVTQPTFGTANINQNGTPDNKNDDFIEYRPSTGADGLERFTYLIVTEDDIRTVAEVTIPLGDTNADALVALDFSLVDANLNPTTSVNVGDTFGVQVNVEDLRLFTQTSVFAGYLDVFYDRDNIRPAARDSDPRFNPEFDFGVIIADRFDSQNVQGVESGSSSVGSSRRLGLIDEFGSFSTTTDAGPNPDLLATLFFEAIASGSTTVTGGPADSFPFQDTLLFGRDDAVATDQIRYDALTINIGSATTTAEGEAIQNPVLAQDVNNDGSVSPIDALVIINEMSRLPAEGEAGSRVLSSFYTDVNGDSRTSAIDALQVINYLTRRTNTLEAEGESVLAPLAESKAIQLDSSVVSDEVFADLSESDDVLSVDSPAQTPAVLPQLTSSDADDSDDDETNVYDLLADDIQGLWS